MVAINLKKIFNTIFHSLFFTSFMRYSFLDLIISDALGEKDSLLSFLRVVSSRPEVSFRE